MRKHVIKALNVLRPVRIALHRPPTAVPPTLFSQKDLSFFVTQIPLIAIDFMGICLMSVTVIRWNFIKLGRQRTLKSNDYCYESSYP